jgi:lipopolysaccharide/colanic/teichoic acid biosynthesis glycosyltransferase
MTADADDWKSEVAPLDKHLRHGGDPRMFKIDDDPRVTRVGGLRRRCSIDELQLFNVVSARDEPRRSEAVDPGRGLVRGGVGPPPARPAARDHRHLAGLGPDGDPVRGDVRLDYLYATGWSLWNDVRLMLGTLPTVVRGTAG